MTGTLSLVLAGFCSVPVFAADAAPRTEQAIPQSWIGVTSTPLRPDAGPAGAAVLGDTGAPRVGAFSSCDIAVGRELLKLIPEMVAFLPCRIAVMEDADGNVWV